MFTNEPFPLQRGKITEQMTDKEISSLNDAIELYLTDDTLGSDCIIANEIPRELWKPVNVYLQKLYTYYFEVKQ